MSSQSLLSAAKTEQERRDAFNVDCGRDPREAFGAKPRYEPKADNGERNRRADKPQGVDATLTERGARYGEFDRHAYITQQIKHTMRHAPKWESLHADQKEALEMVAHKIGRILNGDPDYIDSWHDIAGYVRLVEKRLEAEAA